MMYSLFLSPFSTLLAYSLFWFIFRLIVSFSLSHCLFISALCPAHSVHIGI
jgi:hypothetical protein